ncbi:MAG: hypothetical protein AAB531_01335 [Patescibacteria group bacterium]
MYNWSVNTSFLKKDKRAYEIWKLEQLINFGLNDEKLNTSQLIKYWKELKIDPKRRKLLSFWLWSKQS